MDQIELQKKIKVVEDVLTKVLDEQKLELKTIVDFPKYRQIPIHIQLALAILEQEGATIVRNYTPKEIPTLKK